MPKSKEDLEVLKNERRDNIILSALKVFCEKGYEGSTVDDISKKANCSHGLFYHYFKSKKEIFDNVIESYKNSSNGKIEQILNKDCDNITKLREMTTFFFSNIMNNENFAYYFYFSISRWFIHNETVTESEVIDDVKKHACDKSKKFNPLIMSEFFKNGQKTKEFTDKYSCDECAKLYHSIIQGSTLNYILVPKFLKNKISLPNIDFIIDIFKA